jgi:hypothetical protein
LLQKCVDRDIQRTGYLPGATNGSNGHPKPKSNGASNGHSAANGSLAWKCSDKQKELILKIIDDNRLDKLQIEALANERFGKGVKLLNRMEASGLIEELLETHGGQQKNGRSEFRNSRQPLPRS